MNSYIIRFGYQGDDGYVVSDTKPIEAVSEHHAVYKFTDQFESYEGIKPNIISVTLIKK
jgi:hypothetical protein